MFKSSSLQQATQLFLFIYSAASVCAQDYCPVMEATMVTDSGASLPADQVTVIFDASPNQGGKLWTGEAWISATQALPLQDALKHYTTFLVENPDLIRVFELVLEHGSLAALEVIDTQSRSQLWTEERIAAALRNFLGREQYDVVEFLLANFRKFKGNHVVMQDLIAAQLQATPWNGRPATLLMQSSVPWHPNWDEMFRLSFDRSSQQWQWVLEAWDQAYLKAKSQNRGNYMQLTFERVTGTNDLGSLPDLRRATDLLHRSTNLPPRFFVDNAGLFTPEMYPVVARVYAYTSQLPHELHHLLLKLPVDQFRSNLEADESFREKVRRVWNDSVTGFPTAQLARFEPHLATILPIIDSDSTWFGFQRWHTSQQETIDALWNLGVRPKVDAEASLVLYLAIRFQNHELLAQSVRKLERSINRYAEHGINISIWENNSSKPKQLFPLQEIVSNWDIQAVNQILRHIDPTRLTKTRNPIVVALQAGKIDVCRLLSSIRVKLEAEDLEGIDGIANAIAEWLASDAPPADAATTSALAWHLAGESAENGNMEQLDLALKNIPSRKESGLLLSQYQDWTATANARRIVLAASRQPACLARLQFDCISFDAQVVNAILQVGNPACLQVALRDMNTLIYCKENSRTVLELTRDNPSLAKILAKSGVLDGAPDAIKQLYKEITGSPLQVEATSS